MVPPNAWGQNAKIGAKTRRARFDFWTDWALKTTKNDGHKWQGDGVTCGDDLGQVQAARKRAAAPCDLDGLNQDILPEKSGGKVTGQGPTPE